MSLTNAVTDEKSVPPIYLAVNFLEFFILWKDNGNQNWETEVTEDRTARNNIVESSHKNYG